METVKQQLGEVLKSAFIGKYFKRETVCERDNHVIDEKAFVVGSVIFEVDYLTLQETPTSDDGVILTYAEAVDLADRGTILTDFGYGCRQSRFSYTLTKDIPE